MVRRAIFVSDDSSSQTRDEGSSRAVDEIEETPSDLEPLSHAPQVPISLGVHSGLGEGSFSDPDRFFASRASFNYVSVFVGSFPDLDVLKGLGEGYTYRVPLESERLWMTPEPGLHAIPLLWFEFGFQLPMHPFFGVMYEALGCGIAQLSPNSLIQVSGVIARCAELNVLPSLELLFSVYRVKNYGGQLYLDKKAGRVRLVDAPTSNSGYHSRWMYFRGAGLERVPSWGKIPNSRLKALNHLACSSSKFLNAFHGSAEKYSFEQFCDPAFLNNHCRKAFILLNLPLLIWNSCVYLVIFVQLQGESFKPC